MARQGTFLPVIITSLKKLKVTDYIAEFLYQQGIKHVFGLTGGAVVHLFDSIAKHSDMKPIFNHHEQAGAFAAEAYSKVSNNLGVAFTTTGPGVTNAITVLAAAWLDSVPCIYISGQARLSHTTQGKPIRQFGTQQLEIIPIVKPITKYAVMIENLSTIKYHLQKAANLARTGRPGPVWIDLPLDFQWADIDPDALKSFDPKELNEIKISVSDELIDKCLEMLRSAKRPIVLVGYGVRLARAETEFEQFIERFKIPFLTSWGASDLMPTDIDLNLGRPGIAGQRGANLAMQNCDLLLSIGSHLCIQITGTIYEAFARDAKKIIIDVDKNELDSRQIKIDLSINGDAKDFLTKLLVCKKDFWNENDLKSWKEICLKYKKYNEVLKKWWKQDSLVNQYVFVDTLSDEARPDDVFVVDGGGTNVYISFHALKLKKGQRLILSTGLCSMGSGLPESIGAHFADNKRVVCLCGDGSFQLNVQELQTIKHHQLPVKIFVFNNDGYNSIRQTQHGFLNGNFIGSESKGGMSLPSAVEVAKAYGLKAYAIRNHSELQQAIKNVLETSGPVLCEVFVSRDQEINPTQGFKKMSDGTFKALPLEDMAPLLDREEFDGNMLIEPWN